MFYLLSQGPSRGRGREDGGAGPGFLHALSIRKTEEHPALVRAAGRDMSLQRTCGELSLWYPVWLLFTSVTWLPPTGGLRVFVGTIQAIAPSGLSHASRLPQRRAPSSKGLSHRALRFTHGETEAPVGFPFPVWCLLSPSLPLPKAPRSRSLESQG